MNTGSHSADQAAAGLVALGLFTIALFALVALVLVAFSVWIHWRIAEKAGYPGVWSLLLLVPVFNLVMIIVFAFADWPLELENRRLRAALGIGRPPQTEPPANPPYPLVPPTQTP